MPQIVEASLRIKDGEDLIQVMSDIFKRFTLEAGNQKEEKLRGKFTKAIQTAKSLDSTA